MVGIAYIVTVTYGVPLGVIVNKLLVSTCYGQRSRRTEEA